jgi:hypothetical protein
VLTSKSQMRAMEDRLTPTIRNALLHPARDSGAAPRSHPDPAIEIAYLVGRRG